MMSGSPISTADRPSDREVVFRRLLDASREPFRKPRDPHSKQPAQRVEA
jgi:hypothetical protein